MSKRSFILTLLLISLIGLGMGFYLSYEKSKPSQTEQEPALVDNQVVMNTLKEENLKMESVKSVKYVKKSQVTKKVYYIQLGAFSDQQNSERLLSKVKSMGYSVRLKELKGNKLIAVQVGPFNGYAKAKEHTEVLFDRLSDEEITQVFISHYLVTE